MIAKKTRNALLVISIVLLLVFVAGLGSQSYAKTVKTKISAAKLEAGKQFVLTDMPYTGVQSIIKEYNGKTVTPSGIQNFAFTPDGKYVLNIGVCRIEDKEHPLLTRCLRPEEPSPDAEALCVDATVLYGYAHPEVLEITQPNLEEELYHVWVASNPAKNYMGREITRLTYEVINGETYISDHVTVYGFKKANTKNGKATTFKGKKAPVAVSVSIDTLSDQIMFRLRMPGGYGVVYVSYDFSRLNSALDALPDNGRFNITKARKYQRAILRCALRPYDSLQSFDLIGNTIYLCGGHFNKGAGIYAIKFKKYPAGKAVEQVKSKLKQVKQIITITSELRINRQLLKKDKLEIEGMKVFRRTDGKIDYYINFVAVGTGLRSTIGIYRFEA